MKLTDKRAGFRLPVSAAKFTMLIGSGVVSIGNEARVAQSARYKETIAL